MPTPTTASTTRLQSRSRRSGTAASVIAMISADRMKSVLMAPATFCVLERLRVQRQRADLRLVGVGIDAGRRLEDLLGALVAEVGAADHQQRRDRPRREAR